MPQDAFTLKYVTKELDDLFTGGKISKINQPAKDLISLLIYTAKGTVKLDIDLSAKYCRVSAAESLELPNPKNAPNFCMLLRKHLQNAEVLHVGQDGFERVVYFDLKCFSEFEVTTLRLYLEIMGKYSNAALVKDGIILGALKTASLETGARRVMMSGAKYRPPEKQDKTDPTDLAALRAAFENRTGDAVRFIAEHVTGIAHSTAVDIVSSLGEGVDADGLYAYLNGECVPCLVVTDGEPTDFRARMCEGGEKRPSLLEAQAEFYTFAVKKKLFTDEKRRLTSAVASAKKKAEKQLAQTREKLAECERAELIKLQGELITANIYAVERGMTRFEAVNYYDEAGGKIVIELDPVLTPSQNAQKYYKRYAKLKRTAENLNARKAESEARLEYLSSICGNLERAEDSRDLEETAEELIALSLLPPPKTYGKKKGKIDSGAPFRRFVYKGFTVVCGRNNLQNDRLTRGLAPTDVWLHVKTFPSSHVGILTGGAELPDGVIKFAAEVCAYYSDARGKDKVQVDYTYKKYVKKPNGAHSGFAVYTDFETINVAPDAHREERQDE